jgi:hypothetical protein
MPTRTFDDGFYPAPRARDIAAGDGAANSEVLLEINSLQIAVDAAAKTGQLTIEVGISESNATGMTDAVTGPIFREAFVGTAESFASAYPSDNFQLRKVQMERVIGYFTRLGYSIKRVDQTTGSPATFNWVINW